MEKLKAHSAIIGANIIYGINYTVAKSAMNAGIGPLGFIVIRVGLAAVLFWICHFIFSRQKIDKKDIPRLMLCGCFGVAINQMLFFSGLNITTQINASLIMTVTPILVLVLSAIFIKEKITIKKIIGMLVAALGAILLLSFKGNFSFGSETALGDSFIFINATSYALYLVIVKPLMHKYNAITVISWVFSFGLIPVCIFGWQQFSSINWNFTPVIWASIAFVVIGTTFFTYLLNIYGLGKVKPSIVGLYIYTQPLIATVIATTFGGTQLNSLQIFAGLLIFMGVFMVTFNVGLLKPGISRKDI